MSLGNFVWLAEELRNDLAQDPLGHGQPVEAQLGVGLYGLAHGTSFVTMAHVFRIGKETAEKVLGCFVNAVLKNPEDWHEIMASFERRQGIPWVVSVIIWARARCG
ncbi:hypothetical protein VP01_7050g1, partial [Puccinia sorghi]